MSVPVSRMHTDAVHVMVVFCVVTEMIGVAAYILTVIFICHRIHHRCIYGSCDSKGCQCSKRDQANHQIFFFMNKFFLPMYTDYSLCGCFSLVDRTKEMISNAGSLDPSSVY